MDNSHAPKGAFVEIDQSKMTRDQLVLLGMKEAHDKWIEKLDEQITMLGPGLASALYRDLQQRMAEYRDTLAVVLTKAAVKSGAGSLHNIKAEI